MHSCSSSVRPRSYWSASIKGCGTEAVAPTFDESISDADWRSALRLLWGPTTFSIIRRGRRRLRAAEELAQHAAAVGPEHQRHTHQRASGHHARGHRQGELFGEFWFPSFEQERNERAEEK